MFYKVPLTPESPTDPEGKDKALGPSAVKPLSPTSLQPSADIKGTSIVSFDDFDQLLESASHIVRSFKSDSLKGNALYDAIFGLLYVYVLPAIPVCASDKALLLKLVDKMGEDVAALSAAAADSCDEHCLESDQEVVLQNISSA